jgi:hypothetical protein
MPTWVNCTTLQDDPVLVNLDNVSTLQRNTKAIPNYTTIAFIGGITASVKVKETPEQIANVKQLHGKEQQ